MFYVLEVSTGDSSIAGSAVYRYDTLNEAIATFHSKLGSAMKSALFESELVMVVDSEGAVYRTEKYTKPAAGPAEEGGTNE